MMDHVVIPVDAAHGRAAAALVAADRRESAAHPTVPGPSHITLASFEPLPPPEIRAVVEEVAARTEPFVVHAHGYGLFIGDRSADVNLHVPVIRGPALEALRSDLHRSLAAAGAKVAPWLGPDEWSPHITLVERDSSDDGFVRLLGRLLQRHHPSWHIPVEALAVSTKRHGVRHWDAFAVGRR